MSQSVENLISTLCPSITRSASLSGLRSTFKSRAAHQPEISCSPILPTCRDGRVLIQAKGLRTQSIRPESVYSLRKPTDKPARIWTSLSRIVPVKGNDFLIPFLKVSPGVYLEVDFALMA